MQKGSTEQEQAINLSLGEFLKQLAAALHRQNIKMPFKHERPWHVLFYTLKTNPEGKRLGFFEELRFDWDGPYPKSQELSDFLQALHWNAGVSASNPHYETITLPEETAALWSERLDSSGEEVKSIVLLAAALAKQEFSING